VGACRADERVLEGLGGLMSCGHHDGECRVGEGGWRKRPRELVMLSLESASD
jgi:hypothetical protein